jgi:hypothetical protein
MRLWCGVSDGGLQGCVPRRPESPAADGRPSVPASLSEPPLTQHPCHERAQALRRLAAAAPTSAAQPGLQDGHGTNTGMRHDTA